jgi:AAA15 family ATPase/GTPase
VLYGFTISNFRNFGDSEQWISPLGRVNIFIGSNNSGKSNVLRFVKRILTPFFRAAISP